MELEFQQVQIPYLRSVLYETVLHEESGETVVPDTMPDMERIVDSYACVVLRSRECQGDAVSLAGDIQAGLSYMAAGEDTPRQITAYLPFSLRRSAPGASQCAVTVRVRSVEGRMLNSRKAGLRVGLCVVLQAWEPTTQHCFAPGEPERRVQLRCADYPMRLPVEYAEKDLLLRDSLPLDAGQPEARRIVHADAQCRITDGKLSGSQAVCKGEVQLSLLYETMDLELCSAALTLPFSGLVELEDSYEEQGAEITPVLTSLNAALENGAVTAEAGVCLQCLVTQMVSVPMVEDAYATRGVLHTEYQSCALQPRLDSRLLRQELRHELPVQAAEVVRAEALPDAPELQYGDGAVRVRTPVLLRVLYRDAGGEYRQTEGRTELSVELPAEDALCRAEVWPDGVLFAAPAAGRIELRLPLALRLCWYDGGEKRCVSALGLDDAPREERPAVVIRTLEEDTALWDVAKELRTTVSAIQTANDLEGETAPAGVMLLIPIVA